MKFVIRHFFILFAFSFLAAFGQDYKDCLLKADKYYQAGDKEKAKEYYLKAAKLGSADAHFAIAYKFTVTKEESIFHFSEEAKLGHGQALMYALDELLFRANSLTEANPRDASGHGVLARYGRPAGCVVLPGQCGFQQQFRAVGLAVLRLVKARLEFAFFAFLHLPYQDLVSFIQPEFLRQDR